MGLRTERWVTARQKVDEESYLSHLGRKARNMAVFVALDRAEARCRPAQGHRARDSVPRDTMLGFPCVWAALRVGMGGAPPKAQPFADPPAHGPRPPVLRAFKCPHQLSVFTETHLQENFMSPL